MKRDIFDRCRVWANGFSNFRSNFKGAEGNMNSPTAASRQIDPLLLYCPQGYSTLQGHRRGDARAELLSCRCQSFSLLSGPTYSCWLCNQPCSSPLSGVWRIYRSQRHVGALLSGALRPSPCAPQRNPPTSRKDHLG